MSLKKFLVGMTVFWNLSVASGESVTVSVYYFTSTFDQLIKGLEIELVEAGKKLCRFSETVSISSPAVKIQSGPTAPPMALQGILNLKTENASIDFPSHPYAALTADVSCK